MRYSLCLVTSLLVGFAPSFQDPVPTPTPPPTVAKVQPSAKSEDVASIDAIVAALYAVISGPAGQQRDFDRMRSLFHPDARLVPMLKGPTGMRTRVLTIDDYVLRSGPMLERDGFFEQEIYRTVEQFGDFAHVWSTYEARRALADAKPFMRGINSMQLVRQDGRWHVLQILWEQEVDAGPIPTKYLPTK